MKTLHVYVGDRLGFDSVLAERPDASPGERARAVGIAERYAREWLKQQAVAGLLDVRRRCGVAIFELQDGLIVGGRLLYGTGRARSNIEQAVEMQSGLRPAD